MVLIARADSSSTPNTCPLFILTIFDILPILFLWMLSRRTQPYPWNISPKISPSATRVTGPVIVIE